MTPHEFATWWRGYAQAFPSVSKWINDLGDSAKPQLRLWAETLEDVPLREAMAITRAMATDRMPAIGSFDSDREATARIIRRAVLAKLGAEKRDRKERDLLERPTVLPIGAVATDQQGRPVTLRDMLRIVSGLRNAGRTAEQARDELNRTLVWRDDFDFQRDAHDCFACQDRGTVEVWRPDLVQVAIATPQTLLDNPRLRRSCAAPCSCQEGMRRIWTDASPPPKGWAGWRSKLTAYSSERMCRVTDPGLGDEETLRFVDWCVVYRRRCDEYWRTHGGTGPTARQQDMGF